MQAYRGSTDIALLILNVEVGGRIRLHKGRHHSNLCTSTVFSFLCSLCVHTFNSPALEVREKHHTQTT